MILDVTTQMTVRLDILPITKRYRTDLLSQKLRKSSVKFYTDIIFAHGASVQGNNCAR